MLLLSLNRQQGICKKNIAKRSNFLNAFQLTEAKNADFSKFNNKLSIMKEIIKEINQLKYAYCNLPDDTDLKDALEITIDLEEETQQLEIAGIFDPLGLLGPVSSKAKFFMQQLWLLKLEWHEKLPVPVATEWASFVQSLPVFEKLTIPRFVLSENVESIILYGFSDASEKEFGAVTYISVIKNSCD
ncbi:uncharacterized protein TNCV_3742301 [Trichonephila clavipes]|nr:uncharacterized protein TNCV_3742301 [Trichonephila clavipes]